jgi:hypothetical protein
MTTLNPSIEKEKQLNFDKITGSYREQPLYIRLENMMEKHFDLEEMMYCENFWGIFYDYLDELYLLILKRDAKT